MTRTDGIVLGAIFKKKKVKYVTCCILNTAGYIFSLKYSILFYGQFHLHVEEERKENGRRNQELRADAGCE